MQKREAVLVLAKRTAIGRAGGMFRQILPENLAAAVIRDVLKETNVPSVQVDDCILGNAVGPGGNIARLSWLAAGLPLKVPGLTVDRQCGSGLEAIIYAARLVVAGAGKIFIAGGVESVSRAPWKIEKPAGLYEGLPRFYNRARFSPPSIGDPEMGEAAENVAKQYGISRKDQDQYALKSQQKAIAAIESGRFAGEIVSVYGKTVDECPRKNLSPRLLARMPAAFVEGGTVTCGNACPINDGAACVLVMEKEKALSYHLPVHFKVLDAACAGVDPQVAGIGAVFAVQKLLKRNGLTVDDIDYFEMNEAFAAQVIATLRELKIPEEKVNHGGGAIALGHPYGASGAILVTRLLAEMGRKKLKYGVAMMAIGGGMGIALLVARDVNEDHASLDNL